MYVIKRVKKYTNTKSKQVKREVLFFVGSEQGFPVFGTKSEAKTFTGPDQALEKLDEMGLSDSKEHRIQYLDLTPV